MQTATLDDLRNRLPTILAWLESGEDVVVKGKPATEPQPPGDEKVDWSKSAVFQRPKSAAPLLTHEDIKELFDDLRGPY